MNKRIGLVLLLIIFGANIQSFGQRTITGRLIDKETGKPIKDALVTQLSNYTTTTSNALGFFQMQVDSAVTFRIQSPDYVEVEFKAPEQSNFRIELTKLKPAEEQSDEIYAVIETPASFPGGLSKFYTYVGKNIKMPREVWSGAVNGKVIVQFVIDSTGTIPPETIIVTQSLCKQCDVEAIRLIKGSPKWNPGLQKDKPVRQRMSLPIIFK